MAELDDTLTTGALELDAPPSDTEGQATEESPFFTVQDMVGALEPVIDRIVEARLNNHYRGVQGLIDQTASRIVNLERQVGEAFSMSQVTQELLEAGVDPETATAIKERVKQRRELDELRAVKTAVETKAPVNTEQQWDNYFYDAVLPDLMQGGKEAGLSERETQIYLETVYDRKHANFVPVEKSIAGYRTWRDAVLPKIAAEGEKKTAGRKPPARIPTDRGAGGQGAPSADAALARHIASTRK